MSLRVLGLDPGTATFGWGMVESGVERPRYLAHGLITTSPSLSLGERLLQIRTELTQIARSERPDNPFLSSFSCCSTGKPSKPAKPRCDVLSPGRERMPNLARRPAAHNRAKTSTNYKV